jgi:hypothetical protein
MVRYGKVHMSVKAAKAVNRLTAIGEAPGNGGALIIDMSKPYIATVAIEGVADILFHRWSNEDVKAKGDAAKGSEAKKFDNLQEYVYRCDDGTLAIPGEYLRGAIVGASKFRQDPRSPRKSMADLMKAAVVSLTPLATLGAKDWDYEDRRRVTIQRNAITRCRPAMKAGWKCEFDLLCNLPEYVSPSVLNEIIQQAGRLIGLADFRPTYGRFQVVGFSVRQD